MTATLRLDHDASDSSTRRALSSLSSAVVKSKRIVVLTGAGISCSSGIPDFRSADGLYSMVKNQYPDVVLKGRDLFDASLFRDRSSTSLFYTFISKLKSAIDLAEPSPTHRFIKTLENKGKLLRSYTQNIDGLEERVGLSCKPSGKGKGKAAFNGIRSVLLHGNIHEVRCQLCSVISPFSEQHLSSFSRGDAPPCEQCSARNQVRIESSKRALKVGSLRPAIVLYDEPHPSGDLIGSIQAADMLKRPDLLIIMGTSLRVYGLKKLVKEFARVVHSSKTKNGIGGGKVVFVNLTEPPGAEWENIIDYHVLGSTDKWVDEVEQAWHHLRPSDWEVQTTLLDKSGGLKIVKKITQRDNSKENVAPKLAPPSSPSKRRSKATHYDAPSSPKKKRAVMKEVVNCDDRKSNLPSDQFQDPFLTQ